LSLPEEQNDADEYDWNEPNPHDPDSLGTGWSFTGAEGICGVCFEKIIQPIIKGIWYHKDHWDVKQKDHQPVPASELLQMFYYFMLPNKSYDRYEKSKKCRHSRWWSDTLDFPPINEGFHHEHYYMTNYQTLCGRIMDIQRRRYYTNDRAVFPKTQWSTCRKCLDRLEKIGMVKIVTSGRATSRQRNIKWLKKKLTKDFIKSEKAKYTKVLK
jgi:hypothetical protein